MTQRGLLHGGSTTIPAALYLLVSLLCTQFPLLHYLGYEFSAAIALVASIVSGVLTIRFVKKVLAGSGGRPPSTAPSLPLTVFRRSLLFNLVLLLIPLVVMLTNALFVKNCSMLEGFGFFLLIPAVSVVFSTALGVFCGVHYRYAKTMFVLFVLATFAEVLAVGYFTPAIFSYNFFYGYFPGLTYDEILGISPSLVLFRLLTLILAAGLVWMAVLITQNSDVNDASWAKGVALIGAMVQGRAVFVTAALTTVVIVTWWFRGELGFDSTSNFIRKSLGQVVETEHFRIYYSQESYNAEEIRWIAAEHEFRLKQVAGAFNLPRKEVLESYIYPSNEAKRRLMGAGNTNIAKPWSGQIHISHASLDAVLKHELVHVVAARFGAPVLKASFSTGLVEGLAMAIEWDWGNRTPHQYAAAMRAFGAGTDIRSIISPAGFASQASSVSYVLAGSFCRFLIDTYGMRNMAALYRSAEYEAIYGKPLDSLVAEWHRFLDTIPVDDQERDVVDVLFRRPPIFDKVCARVVAARNARARSFLAQKRYSDAQALFRQSYDETSGYEAFSGLLAAAHRGGNYEILTTALDSLIMLDERPSQYLPLFLMIGDAFWIRGMTERAMALYRRVEVANLSEGLTEAARLRQHAAAEPDSEWRLYFLSDENDSGRVAALREIVRHSAGSWLPRYLLAQLLLRGKQFDEAAHMLGTVNLQGVDPILEARRLKMLGASLFRLKRFEEAKAAFWRSMNSVSTEVARFEVNDWVERCEWMKTNTTPAD